MKVRTIVAFPVTSLPRRRLSSLARRVLRGEGGSLDVRIIFAGDELVRRLNARFRRMNRTTDVLSFNVPGVAGVVPDAGEIYLSVPQAKRQARRYRQPLVAELERLVVHGVLHLLGHDHKKREETQRMRSRERHYLGGRL